MSKQDPPSQRLHETEASQRRRPRPIELERSSDPQPELRWVAVEDPDQSFLLREDDYILDSHFNPQFDAWEVLIRLEPDSADE